MLVPINKASWHYVLNAPIAYTLSGILFCLSLVLINPWGSHRGAIWTEPRLSILGLITILNLSLLLQNSLKEKLILPRNWKIGTALWGIFILFGCISSSLSPAQARSLWGQSTLGDGWLYWLLMAVFVLSNALVIRIQPKLMRFQAWGLLVGGAIVALSIFPQIIDWRIDYTSTSGLISSLNSQRLESTIWLNDTPIGLYSNRGHTAFVLAAIALLCLLSIPRNWLKLKLAIPLYGLLAIALLCTGIRIGILALLTATGYYLGRYVLTQQRWRLALRSLTVLVAIGFLSSSYGLGKVGLAGNPPALSLAALEAFASGRLHLWKLALQGIAQRPLWGWGFDGLGIAFPFIGDWSGQHRWELPSQVAVDRVLALHDFTFSYLGTDRQVYTGLILTNKAHNLFLDTGLSLGIFGLIAYSMLFGFFFWLAYHSAFRGIETIALVYLIYTQAWYESAQFSQIVWWAFSIGLALPGRSQNNYLISQEN